VKNTVATYIDVEGLRGLYRQECEASPSLLTEASRCGR
jgi:hypothetical protein